MPAFAAAILEVSPNQFLRLKAQSEAKYPTQKRYLTNA